MFAIMHSMQELAFDTGSAVKPVSGWATDRARAAAAREQRAVAM
jgi:hypothetical protein